MEEAYEAVSEYSNEAADCEGATDAGTMEEYEDIDTAEGEVERGRTEIGL